MKLFRTLSILVIAVLLPTASQAVPEWVVEELTVPEQGSFGDPQIAPDGSIWWTTYNPGLGITASAGPTTGTLFRNGVPFAQYDQPISLYDVRSGRLSVAQIDVETKEWSMYVDGVLFGTTYYNVNLPRFDQDGNSFWVREEQFGERLLVTNNIETSICNYLPEGRWVPCGSYHYTAWPIGMSHGIPYFSVTEFRFNDLGEFESLDYLTTGRSQSELKFPDLTVINYVMKHGLLLVYGEDQITGRREFQKTSVDDGKVVTFEVPTNDTPADYPISLAINESGDFFYSAYFGYGGDEHISCRVVRNNQLLLPLDVSNVAMWPHEWNNNVIVWQQAFGDNGSQIMKATYLDREVADFDGSGCTDVNDFLIVLDHWQELYLGQVVGLEDFLSLIDHWRGCRGGSGPGGQ